MLEQRNYHDGDDDENVDEHVDDDTDNNEDDDGGAEDDDDDNDRTAHLQHLRWSRHRCTGSCQPRSVTDSLWLAPSGAVSSSP